MSGLQMKYFVLKPRGDDAYAVASKKAMEVYADYIEEENPELSYEIRSWVKDEQI